MAFRFRLTFITSETLNFAQGSCVMLGAMLAITLVQLGWPFPLVFAVVVLALGVFGALTEMVCVRPIKDRTRPWLDRVELGLAIVIDNVAGLVWGTLPIEFPSPLTRRPLHILGAVICARTPDPSHRRRIHDRPSPISETHHAREIVQGGRI